MASISVSDIEHRRQSYFSDLTHEAPMQSPDPLLKVLDASTACLCTSTCDVCPSRNTWRYLEVCPRIKVVTDWKKERVCSTCSRTSSLALCRLLSCALIFSHLIRAQPFVLSSMSALFIYSARAVKFTEN